MSEAVALASAARAAARDLAAVAAERKNAWLIAAAAAIDRSTDDLLAANRLDRADAPAFGLTPAQVDRLTLTPDRIRATADGLRGVAALPDPVGVVLDQTVRPNGLLVERLSVPVGVILFIYESRPNVTADAAALAVKSGNAILLRGGKEAAHSNRALADLLRATLADHELPANAVTVVPPGRELVGELLRLRELIDLAIPRGGEGLIERVSREAAMPVLRHSKGNCHVYVDRAADPDMAERIVVNAKCSRPGVCNAAETLLVHADVAAAFVPRVCAALARRGVELRGCARTRALWPAAIPAAEADYAAEFLAPILAVRVVDDLGSAIEHIHAYGSGHTEAIVTGDAAAARQFTTAVDAAAVMVNASTRFHDGGEFGLGAEIGISTDKFHARGPCGLRELTTYKYRVTGTGQVRE